MSYPNQHELGLAGLALLRNWLIGNEMLIQHVLDEAYTLTNRTKNASILDPGKASAYNIHEGYERWASTYDILSNPLLEIEEPVVKSLLSKFSPGRALDAGCGTGRYSKFLYSLGHTVIGIDQSQTMLHRAQICAQQVDFLESDLTHLPIQSESIDLAICALVLTHFSDIRSALLELSRVISVGGHVVISDIHPWLVALGGQADFRDRTGGYGYITNYVHWHSTYLRTFSNVGLRVLKCVEPTIRSEHIEMLREGLGLSTETVTAALQDLPIALVWILERC